MGARARVRSLIERWSRDQTERGELVVTLLVCADGALDVLGDDTLETWRVGAPAVEGCGFAWMLGAALAAADRAEHAGLRGVLRAEAAMIEEAAVLWQRCVRALAEVGAPLCCETCREEDGHRCGCREAVR